MIIIITGAPGSGKTQTAIHLLDTTDNSAFIDGDTLLGVNPFNRNNNNLRLLRYKNIAAVTKNYHEAGYATIIISFVYMDDNHISEQIHLFDSIDTVAVFALVPKNEVLTERHKNDSYKREAIDSSIILNNAIGRLKSSERIDNSIISIEEIGNIIKKKIQTLT